MIIKLLIDGGKMMPGPAIAQQLGPMGINIGKVISDVNEATKDFIGMKVPVKLDINEKTKDFTISTSSPPTSELLKKELNLEKGTPDHKNQKMGNASIEDVIKVTRIKYSDMLEKEFKSGVKSVLGTCASIGILVENKEPNELIEEVRLGKFDKEIEAKSIETNPEKREQLNIYFNELKTEQESKLAEKQREAEEAEAAKAEKTKKGAEEKAEGTEATPTKEKAKETK